MDFITEYKESFKSAYPHHEVRVKPKKQRDGTVKYAVIINQEAGDITLSESDMRYATRLFNRGRN